MLFSRDKGDRTLPQLQHYSTKYHMIGYYAIVDIRYNYLTEILHLLLTANKCRSHSKYALWQMLNLIYILLIGNVRIM